MSDQKASIGQPAAAAQANQPQANQPQANQPQAGQQPRGITLPEGQESVKAFLHLSRTWKPSDHGEDDQRALGVGIVADFTTNPTLALEQHRTVKVSSCGAGI